MHRLAGLGLAIAAVVATSAQTPTLHFTAPKDWTVKPSSSPMRVAQYTLPRATGDAEDAELIVYFFGGQGGSVEANLDRWVGQMEQPDGRPSKAVARTETLTVNGMKATVLDVSGKYIAEMAPGSTTRYNKLVIPRDPPPRPAQLPPAFDGCKGTFDLWRERRRRRHGCIRRALPAEGLRLERGRGVHPATGWLAPGTGTPSKTPSLN